MATIRIKLEIEPVLRSMRRLGTGLAEKAIKRSLNRTITGVRTAASRSVRQHLTLKAKDVNKELSVRRANTRTLSAAVDIQATAVGLIKFRARATRRKGVTVQVKKRGGRKQVPNAFIRTMDSGHRGVFVRRGLARLPIRELLSTSVQQYLKDDEVLNPLQRYANERFTRDLTKNVEFLLR